MYIKAETYSNTSIIAAKLRAYFELTKFRLTSLVTFSSALGYLLGNNGSVRWMDLIMFSLGGFFITSSGVTINQVLERDLDKLMKRTMNRPLPTQRVSVAEAMVFAMFTFSAGIFLLAQYANLLTTVLAILSLVLYSFIYTPLKRVGPVAVFIGAIPGALPPLLGWVAATGSISMNAMVIFLLQFLWQFPHFWAIAWIADDDYKIAGFKLLPGSGIKNAFTAVHIMAFTILLIPAGFLPFRSGISGISSCIIIAISGLLFLYPAIKLVRDQSRKSALRLMYSSFLYLPVTLIALLIDKI
jgi:heme o synthase